MGAIRYKRVLTPPKLNPQSPVRFPPVTTHPRAEHSVPEMTILGVGAIMVGGWLVGGKDSFNFNFCFQLFKPRAAGWGQEQKAAAITWK